MRGDTHLHLQQGGNIHILMPHPAAGTLGLPIDKEVETTLIGGIQIEDKDDSSKEGEEEHQPSVRELTRPTQEEDKISVDFEMHNSSQADNESHQNRNDRVQSPTPSGPSHTKKCPLHGQTFSLRPGHQYTLVPTFREELWPLPHQDIIDNNMDYYWYPILSLNFNFHFVLILFNWYLLIGPIWHCNTIPFPLCISDEQYHLYPFYCRQQK